MSPRWVRDFDNRIEKIIEKKDELIQLQPHINGMWNGNLYVQYINLFNYIFDKNMQVTGCGACRTKIKNIFDILYSYMKQKNIN
jgi:hypothetical protein